MHLSSPALAVLAASTGSSKGTSITSFIPLLLIVVVGYMLLVRPARNRQRKAAENRAQIQPGVEVTTTAGLLATVVSVDEDDVITLEIAPGVHARFLRGAIARVHSTFEEPTGEHEALGEHEAIPEAEASTGETSTATEPTAEEPKPEQTDL